MDQSYSITENISADLILDVQKLNNPIPVLRAKKEITRMAAGQILLIKTSHPNSKLDFITWCNNSKHEFMGEKKTEEGFNLYVKN